MLRFRLGPLLLVVALLCAPAAAARVRTPADEGAFVRTVTIQYRAHNGVRRAATVLVPADFDPHIPLPLIISAHGRGVDGATNARLWGDLPGRYGFVVVNPDGEGRRLGLYSWGWRGEIDDLARMPEIVARALPHVRIDRGRVYAFGGSMGGQEVLLLAAQHPALLAGVSAFDPATDMAERYRAFAHMKNGRELRRRARTEFGGTPRLVPEAYARRSPAHYVDDLAFSGVPMQIWWSTRDRVIRNQASGAGRLYRRIKALNPSAPVEQCKGMWKHTVEMRWDRRLPRSLGFFGLRVPVRPETRLWGHRSPT